MLLLCRASFIAISKADLGFQGGPESYPGHLDLRTPMGNVAFAIYFAKRFHDWAAAVGSHPY